mgnify:CR=1 FL=1
MCIRDRFGVATPSNFDERNRLTNPIVGAIPLDNKVKVVDICLLYTSDAADERSSVDLGGRRIIKKNKRVHVRVHGERLSLI